MNREATRRADWERALILGFIDDLHDRYGYTGATLHTDDIGWHELVMEVGPVTPETFRLWTNLVDFKVPPVWYLSWDGHGAITHASTETAVDTIAKWVYDE